MKTASISEAYKDLPLEMRTKVNMTASELLEIQKKDKALVEDAGGADLGEWKIIGGYMKKTFCIVFFGLIILNGSFALTNGEYIRNIALLVRRWNDFTSRCNSYWESQFYKKKYIGSGSFEDYVYQKGAYAGIAAAMTDAIDKCISLDLKMVDPESYAWLTEKNSDIFYNISQKGSWYNELSADRKKVYDFGYFMGLMAITGESARFPNIWEWKNL